jgi:cystathionine beta-lyase
MASSNLDRRSFLRGAGASALLTAATFEPVLAERPSILLRTAQKDFDFETPYDRVGTNCVKWDTPLSNFDTIEVSMGLADMDFRAAPCITEALAKRCAHENWGYSRRPEGYTKAVVDWSSRRYGTEIDPETVVWSTGVNSSIVRALQVLAPPGSSVLLNTPTYSTFYSNIRFAQNVAEENTMRLIGGRYEIDWEDFELRARRSKVFILCNPQNPTGNCWSAEDMTRMGEICLEHGTVIFSDEIHCDFVREGEVFTPFSSLPNPEVVANSITFRAASKTFTHLLRRQSSQHSRRVTNGSTSYLLILMLITISQNVRSVPV